MEIKELKLSYKTRQCLEKAGVTSIEKLCFCTEEDLMKIKNLGRNCLGEIRDALRKRGYSFRCIPDEMEHPLSIESLKGISYDTYKCLADADIVTIEQLCECSENDLMKIRNLGIKSFREIIKMLMEYGYSLSPEDDMISFESKQYYPHSMIRYQKVFKDKLIIQNSCTQTKLEIPMDVFDDFIIRKIKLDSEKKENTTTQEDMSNKSISALNGISDALALCLEQEAMYTIGDIFRTPIANYITMRHMDRHLFGELLNIFKMQGLNLLELAEEIQILNNDYYFACYKDMGFSTILFKNLMKFEEIEVPTGLIEEFIVEKLRYEKIEKLKTASAEEVLAM